MEDIIERKQLKLGNENYEYTKTTEGKESLTRVETIGNQNIKVVLNNIGQSNSKNIENYIIDVLSDLYIQINIKRLT